MKPELFTSEQRKDLKEILTDCHRLLWHEGGYEFACKRIAGMIDAINDYEKMLEGLERDYKRNEYLKVRASLREWEKELDPGWIKRTRKRYLKAELNRMYEDNPNVTGSPKYKSLHAEYVALKKNKKAPGVTEEEITRAKQFSVTQFVELSGYALHRGGFIVCPFHDEKTPSCKIYEKDNRFHCFGCTEHGDVIDFCQKDRSLSFVEAVRYINSL